MRFGPAALDECTGALLAHGQMFGARRLSKGHVLTADDIATAREAGLQQLVVARLDPGDESEDAAARAVGEALAAANVRAEAPVHGRVNLLAASDGLLCFDPDAVSALNRIDEAITLGTLPQMAPVRQGDVVATIKIIPYAVEHSLVARAAGAAARAALSVAPFVARSVAIIQTRLPGQSDKLLAKTSTVIRARVGRLGGEVRSEVICPHDQAPLAAALASETAASVVLIAGASATVDRRDVVPAAIVAAGGVVDRLGMPVDPGNLLCFGRIGARAVIGLPGCARSPRRNGIDLVLERLFAGLTVDSAAIAGMGIGGLLADSGERPEPRVLARDVGSGSVCALVLAAGRASRMGSNKLAADLRGKPVIAHVCDAIAAAGLPPPLVVLGHDAAATRSALGDRPASYVEARFHAEGLSQSLRAGLEALPADAVAVLVCLGDMPCVPAALLREMAARATSSAILVPRFEGRQGNPVLWGRNYFPRLTALSGDVGAKSLLGEYAEHVRYIDCEDEGIAIDVDTPDVLRRLNQLRSSE